MTGATERCAKGCLLEGITPTNLQTSCSYHQGEQISPKRDLFIICRGPVSWTWGLEGKGCLEILGPGEIWECEGKGQGQLRALGEVRGHWLKREQWLELLLIPTVEERFLSYMRKKLQQQHEWQLVLARGSVRARVAWQLLDLAERFGEWDARTGETFVEIHLTQAQQAQLCGASRARVWQALEEFTSKRWLICSSRGFWVRDKEALRQQSREAF